jgi:hypothetical protein
MDVSNRERVSQPPIPHLAVSISKFQRRKPIATATGILQGSTCWSSSWVGRVARWKPSDPSLFRGSLTLAHAPSHSGRRPYCMVPVTLLPQVGHVVYS